MQLYRINTTTTTTTRTISFGEVVVFAWCKTKSETNSNHPFPRRGGFISTSSCKGKPGEYKGGSSMDMNETIGDMLEGLEHRDVLSATCVVREDSVVTELVTIKLIVTKYDRFIPDHPLPTLPIHHYSPQPSGRRFPWCGYDPFQFFPPHPCGWVVREQKR